MRSYCGGRPSAHRFHSANIQLYKALLLHMRNDFEHRRHAQAGKLGLGDPSQTHKYIVNYDS